MAAAELASYRTFGSLTRKAEHCCGTANNLCGFQVTESALLFKKMVKTNSNEREEKNFGLPFDAFEEVSVSGRHQDASAPGGVDVHPHAVLFANVGDSIERVHRTQHGSAGRGRDHERARVLAEGAFDLAPQMGQVHTTGGIDFDLIEVVRTNTQEEGGLLDRVVGVGRRQHHQSLTSERARRLVQIKIRVNT